MRVIINLVKILEFSTSKQPMQEPAGSQIISGGLNDGNLQLFTEGKAKIYTKYVQENSKGEFIENGVFYNPVQIFNRDITILVMQAYIQQLKHKRGDQFDGVSIIDALSASGLRTIRFLKELTGVKVVYANDISPASHKLMRDNFQLNKLDSSKLNLTMQDANLLLQNEKKNIVFDIIDLDPYGSAVPFLDSAVECIRDGGLLCITCTDTKVTCGPDVSKCYYYYGTTRAKVQHFNENALRIVLSTISSAASRHCKYIEPMVSFQAGFYLRVFVRVRRGKKQCAESGTKIGNLLNCDHCGNYQYHTHLIQKSNKPGVYVPNKQFANSIVCSNCEQMLRLNGPIWLGAINNFELVSNMKAMMESSDFALELKTHKKIYGTLHAILQEKELCKIPLGFNLELICKRIKASTPNRNVLFAGLQSLGFQIEASYITPGFYKTNAPMEVVYDVIKAWKKQSSDEGKYLINVKDEASLNILKREVKHHPDFNHKIEKQSKVALFHSMGDHMGPKGKPESRVLTKQEIEQLKHQHKGKDKKQGDASR